MRAILVGPARERERLRRELEAASVEIVGQFLTTEEARASGTAADALIVAANGHVGGGDRGALPTQGDARLAEPLTLREMQVLEHLAEGLPNKAIAETLGISDQTVKFHVASISGKLGAANRTDAVRRAVRLGLIAL